MRRALLVILALALAGCSTAIGPSPEPTPSPAATATPFVLVPELRPAAVSYCFPLQFAHISEEEQARQTRARLDSDFADLAKVTDNVLIGCDEHTEAEIMLAKQKGIGVSLIGQPGCLERGQVDIWDCLEKTGRMDGVVDIGIWFTQDDPALQDTVTRIKAVAETCGKDTTAYVTLSCLDRYPQLFTTFDRLIVRLDGWYRSDARLESDGRLYRRALMHLRKIAPEAIVWLPFSIGWTDSALKDQWSVAHEMGFAVVMPAQCGIGDRALAEFYDGDFGRDLWPIEEMVIGGPGQPEIVLDPVPRIGDPYTGISGRVLHLDPTTYKIYVLVAGAYPKPHDGAEENYADLDGYFSVRTVTGGTDFYQPRLDIYVVPASYSGGLGNLDGAALAKLSYTRKR